LRDVLAHRPERGRHGAPVGRRSPPQRT